MSKAPLPFQFDPNAQKVEVELVDDLPARPMSDEEIARESDKIGPIASERKAKRLRAWLFMTAGLALLGVIAFESVVYLRDQIVAAPLIGWPLAGLTALAVGAAFMLVWREIRDLTSLKRQETLRAEADRLIESEMHGDAPKLLAQIEAALREAPGAKQGLQRYEEAQQETMNDGELVRLFEKTALAPVDQRAYRLVLESSRDVAILSALSPNGLLDSAFVLSRSLAMLRSIARLYGVRPGYASTLTLLRKGLRNAILAGLADIATHAAVEHMGAGLLAILSARAGQGAGNALLAAKLGVEAIKLTRPMPFVEEEAPRLSHIRKALFDDTETEKNLAAIEVEAARDKVKR